MARIILLIAVIFVPALSACAGNRPDLIERPRFFYVSRNDQFIEPIESALEGARTFLIGILGDSLSYKPRIYIEYDLDSFNKLIGSSFPDWGAAAALPYRQMIAIKSPAHFNLGRSLGELVRHEYAHLALEDFLKHNLPPRWLDEGVAMYTSAEWQWENNFAISKAVVFNNLIPLKEIGQLNRFSQARANTAYSESYLAVQYLIQEYGRETFILFLNNLANRGTIDEAFMESIGSDYDGFEREFFEYLKTRYNVMTLLGDLSFLWLILAGVVLAGFLLHFRKKRKYYKKWDEEERYQSTDFDYGDPDNPEEIDDEDTPWS
jgi:hypothetical protein